MARALKTGDRVAWKSSGGGSVGRVEQKLTSPGKIKGHDFGASEDNPEFLVRSEKSGKIAAYTDGLWTAPTAPDSTGLQSVLGVWMPAFAGMTGNGGGELLA
jgi:Hypervirulence associated proteins TUDOR domain